MFKKIKTKFINFSVYNFFLFLLIINFLLITLAVVFYNGDFSFWFYPFSYAGTVKTVMGSPNSLSSYIYSFDMVLSGVAMFALAYNFYRKINEQKHIFRVLLCVMAGIGFLIASVSPDDIRHRFHVLGSALVIASLWILSTNYLFEIKEYLKKKVYFSLQFILQVPIFAYATAFFFNFDTTSFILQKFALLGLLVALIYSTKYCR